MIKDIPANVVRSMEHRGVEVLRGHAAFIAPNSIRVGDRQLEARHIVIATGSAPRNCRSPARRSWSRRTDTERSELPG